MNSALKPVLTSPSGPQSASLSKPVHPQNQPSSTYGQPTSTHITDVTGNTTTLATSNHPNPTVQQNHYPPMNVYNTTQYNNSSVVAGNNHSIANISQSSGQFSAASKPVYSDGYQTNAGQTANTLPPVSQTLPATHNTQITPQNDEKPQSNGTSPVKNVENSLIAVQPKEKKSPEKSEEKSKKEQSSNVEIKEDTDSALPTPIETSNNITPSTNSIITKENKSTNDSIPLNSVNQIEIKTDNSVNKNVQVEEKISGSVATSKPKHSPKHQKRNFVRAKPIKVDEESSKIGKNEAKTNPKLSGYTVKSKRTRIKTQPYQSPLPEIEIITKISSSTPKSKTNDDKLIVFYKNEFLAVRNSEGNFYICQAVQNIYRSSPKIKIRWLSQDKNEKSGEIYIPDFYDNIDFDCILTNLNMERIDKGRHRLPPNEKERTDSILKRSLAVEKGEVTSPSLTEEHPDGNVSLYKEESQLKKKKRKGLKRKASSPLKSNVQSASNSVKSPEQSKVRKVKKAFKRTTMTSKKTTPEVTKNVTKSTRAEKANLKNDVKKNSNKIDEKKTKLLAKVAKKTMPVKHVAKNSKTNKAMPSSSKVQKGKTATRKTRRSGKK